MIDAKVLEGVKVLIATYGRLTCGVLADKMRMPPSSMVYFLRDAVGAGVLTCESVYVVMEIDKDMQSKGVPPFTLGYIDVRLGKFIDGNTGWNVTRHVVRYLVVDRTSVPSGNVKSGEVA
ncbi:hypothetical protein FPM07_16640 [Salmonella enterica]|nr:hypothetical protein [Salmonella enterica]